MAETDYETGGTSYRVGDQYGSDFRFLIMLRLMSEGAISLDDAEDVLRYTEEYDSPEFVIGMLVGAKDVSPLVVSNALENTEWETSPKQIEEVGIPFSERMKEAGGYFHGAAGLFRGYMSWPEEAAAPYLQNLMANEGGPGFASQIGSQEVPDDTSPKELVDEIERLNEMGALSTSKYNRLISLTKKQGFSPPQTDKAIRELRDVYNSLPPEDTEEAEKRVSALQALGGAGLGFSDIEPTDNIVLDEPTSDDPSIDAPEVTGDVTDIYGEQGSFAADLIANGFQIGGSSEPIATRARADFYGTGEIQDRSTGQAYSLDEWTMIKTDAATQAAYIANKQITPAIEELLNQSFFNNLQGTKPELPEYISRLPVDEQRALREQAMQDRTYFTKMPVEDLAIPSVVPTNPWEASSFDFKVGDGRAQWYAMTVRERKDKMKMMHDQGLVTDEQYEVMGLTGSLNLVAMSIWESVIGFSSEQQFDPLASLKMIADQKRTIEATAPRGSSGGGRIVPRYSVPASLRTIPDYKTLATQTKGIFDERVGRDLEDWELAILADEMKKKYSKQNDQMIAAHKEWWNDSIAGGTVDVDFTDVEDPAAALEYDIEEKYADELDRKERVEDRANSRRMLMDSITTGQRMI